MGGGFFDRIVLHQERLRDLRKFAPARDGDGTIRPKMVFVNSLSDFWHEKLPDKFIHEALSCFELHPTTIIQILTKRPGRMRRILTDRYKGSRVPAHFWIGATCEDNRVSRILDVVRLTKDALGDFTAFASIEPITAPCDKIDLTGIDWVLTGGESGPDARPMAFEWLCQANDKALEEGIPLHFKQYGTWQNNPLYPPGGLHRDRVQRAIAAGEQLADEEKGGATYKGKIYREKPRHFHDLVAQLNRGRNSK